MASVFSPSAIKRLESLFGVVARSMGTNYRFEIAAQESGGTAVRSTNMISSRIFSSISSRRLDARIARLRECLEVAQIQSHQHLGARLAGRGRTGAVLC